MIKNTHTIKREEDKEINLSLEITDNEQSNRLLYLPNENNNNVIVSKSKTHYKNFSIILKLSSPFGK